MALKHRQHVTTAEVSRVHGNVGGSGIGAGSGVSENAEGCGDTSSSPPPTHPSMPDDIPQEVDWGNLFIMPDEEGDHNAAVDEDIMKQWALRLQMRGQKK